MIKRYWIRVEHDFHGKPMLEGNIEEDKDGEWVKYEDIKHLIEQEKEVAK